ncbi:MAG: HAMP domain-containing histidine kinase [Oscillospiraceae bacterium]|nr:HAMP domain-containing histidine kinase [Oscillospiraceae bacterium]
MKKSLFSKFYLVCIITILVSILTLGGAFLMFAAGYFRTEKFTVIENSAEYAVADTIANFKGQQGGSIYIDRKEIFDCFEKSSRATDAVIFLVDIHGKTILCSEGSGCNHSVKLVNETIRHRTQSGDYRETGRLGELYREAHFTVGKPVVIDSVGVVGYVFVSMPADNMISFLMEILKGCILASFVVMLLSFVVIYFMTRKLVAPLHDMVSATKSFGNGDFSRRVEVVDYDEIGELAIAFNNMASSMATMESTRRSFIANVSHELKTPMTTIGGFIDGILDGTIPEEKRNQYLRIVSEEVKRLSRIVRSMLNIARIEAGENTLNRTEVNLTETILQVLFTFEHRINEKNLEIRGLEGMGKQIVAADEDLIHQVVYNLVENAVKFVNRDGYIEFHAFQDQNFAYFSVRNSGTGISKEELPLVFERFYKTDKSRGLDKNGVGLGLHIVKTILNLHGGEIMVSSVEGEYCEFTFTLPIYRQKSRRVTGEGKQTLPENHKSNR